MDKPVSTKDDDMPGGRPTTYTPELAARICSEISTGKSLRKVCKPAGMPAASSVFLWLAKYPEFSEQYARAQSDRTAYWAEEIVEISDDEQADVQRSRLKVDTRKWLMSKMAPKKFGDKKTHELTGANGGPIQTVDLSNATEEQLNALEAIFGPLATASGDDEGYQGGEGEESGES